MAELRPWHHLFGLSWMDFFQGTAASIEPEKDLSHKQQLLDFAIVLPEGFHPPRPLPDGFDNLGRHNLVTFKSYQEALDGEALNELIGHYTNYRKQAGPSIRERLPEDQFRLYAVCVRSTVKLAREVDLRRVQAGVYEAPHFTGWLRIIVVHELPREPHNAMLLLFSAQKELVEFAVQNYQPFSDETSTLLLNLVAQYRSEEIPMPETLEQFTKRAIKELLEKLPVEERLEGLSAEKRLEGVSAEKRLEGLSPDEILESLPPDKLAALQALIQRRGENGGQTHQG